MMIDPISMALTTLLSPKCTLRRAITLYELIAALYEVICLDATESMIYLYTFLKCALLCITYAQSSSPFVFSCSCSLICSKNVQCGLVCCNRIMILRRDTKVNCRLCFVALPWRYLHLEASSSCTSTCRISNMSSWNPPLALSLATSPKR